MQSWQNFSNVSDYLQISVLQYQQLIKLCCVPFSHSSHELHVVVWLYISAYAVYLT